jgi:hypothetical protein
MAANPKASKEQDVTKDVSVATKKTKTLEDIFKILDERLPSKDKLATLQPKGKDQIISALDFIAGNIEEKDKKGEPDQNCIVAKNKIMTAINLLKQ